MEWLYAALDWRIGQGWRVQIGSIASDKKIFQELIRMVCTDNTKIVFIHIPQKGGTTFRGILQNLYGDSFHYCTSADVGDIRRRI